MKDYMASFEKREVLRQRMCGERREKKQNKEDTVNVTLSELRALSEMWYLSVIQ